MKYIIINNGLQDIPIMFADLIPHISMQELMVNSKEFPHCKCVSAGFILLPECTCFGESTTLNLKSRLIDSDIIRYYDYDHGLGNLDFIKSILKV